MHAGVDPLPAVEDCAVQSALKIGDAAADVDVDVYPASHRHAARQGQLTSVQYRRARPSEASTIDRRSSAGSGVIISPGSSSMIGADTAVPLQMDEAAKKVPQHGTVGPRGPRLHRFASQQVEERTPGDRVGRLRPAFHDLTNDLELGSGDRSSRWPLAESRSPRRATPAANSSLTIARSAS